MYKVAVIMSTYNGNDYFGEQVRSILFQKDVDVHIFIRDDGSSDNRFINRMREISSSNNITVDFGDNLGVGTSFFNCLCSISDVDKYDYYAFADQDDVWLDDKLICAIKKIENLSGKVLYTSNQYIVDKHLENKHNRFTECPGITYGEIIRGNEISGCTFVFNKELFKFLIDTKNIPSGELLKVRIHDVWVAEVAALFGKIVYDETPHILYRQHGNNIVGAKEYSALKKLLVKLTYLKKAQTSAPYLCKELYQIFGERLGIHKTPIYCFAFYQESFLNCLKINKWSSDFQHRGENSVVFFIKSILKIL